MRKKEIFLTLGLLLLAIGGCNQETKDATNKKENNKNTIALTQYEKELSKDNPDIGAQLLIRKAILDDMQSYNMSDKEKNELEFIKDNMAVSYYLEKKLANDIKVTDEEISKVYEDNKDKIGEKSLKEIHNELKQLLTNEKRNQELITYYNNLVQKYNLNEILRSEFPADKKEDTKDSKTNS